MASAAMVRRKLASVKAKARAAGKRRRVRAATTAKTPQPAPIVTVEAPRQGPDFSRAFVSLAGEERMRKLGAFSPTEPPLTRRLPPIRPPAPETQKDSAAQDPAKLPNMHWVWTSLAYLALVALATEAAMVLPADASNSEAWTSFGLWSFFVVAAACVMVLTWRNLALPAILVSFALFLLAWRAPFLSVGVFTDVADWTTHASPWWSLLVITFIVKSIETRGVRRHYQVRVLMVLQGMQIATYAGLVLLSIFFLGRNGAIHTAWAITVIALLAAWLFQGRAVLTMWNLNVATTATVENQKPVWSTSAEHTGK